MKYRLFTVALLSVVFLTSSCAQKKRTGSVQTTDNPSLPVQDEELSMWIAANRQLADSLYAYNHYPEANKLYESLLKHVHNDGELYIRRGTCRVALDEIEGARADYFKAINLGYQQATAYFNVGTTYLEENDSLAAFYLEKAVSIDPKDKRSRLLLGKIKECRARGVKFGTNTLTPEERSQLQEKKYHAAPLEL